MKNDKTAVERFRTALVSLKRGDCWCEAGIGNPMFKGHSEACKNVHALLASEKSAMEKAQGQKQHDGFNAQSAKQFICGLVGQLYRLDGQEKTVCDYNLAIDDAIEAIIFHFPLKVIPQSVEAQGQQDGLINQIGAKLYAIFADGCGCECCNIVEKELSAIIKWMGYPVEQTDPPKDLLEELSELEHDQWMRIRQSTFDKAVELENGSYTINPVQARDWKNMLVPYNELSEKLKEYDRIEARKVLEVVSRHPQSVEAKKPKRTWPFLTNEEKDLVDLHDEVTDKYYLAEGKGVDTKEYKDFCDAATRHAKEWLRIYDTQKPTAHASLVKALEDRIKNKAYANYDDECQTEVIPVYEITDVLNAYRPETPTADKGVCPHNPASPEKSTYEFVFVPVELPDLSAKGIIELKDGTKTDWENIKLYAKVRRTRP